jgi:hypothetical protein
MMILCMKDKSRNYVNPPRSSFPALTLPRGIEIDAGEPPSLVHSFEKKPNFWRQGSKKYQFGC